MNETTKIILAGGNGFLAKLLINKFLELNYKVVSLNRHRASMSGNFKEVLWDGKNTGSWTKELEGASVVINLVGRSVDCRYTEANKKEILNSRLHSTAVIGKAIQMAKNPPKLWINASSATIYRDSLEQEMDEFDGEIGNDFSVDVCQRWEAKAKQ